MGRRFLQLPVGDVEHVTVARLEATGVGSTEPASRRRLDGAGNGAEAPARPAPQRQGGAAGFAGGGAGR